MTIEQDKDADRIATMIEQLAVEIWISTPERNASVLPQVRNRINNLIEDARSRYGTEKPLGMFQTELKIIDCLISELPAIEAEKSGIKNIE
jgi:hypothetical protein